MIRTYHRIQATVGRFSLSAFKACVFVCYFSTFVSGEEVGVQIHKGTKDGDVLHSLNNLGEDTFLCDPENNKKDCQILKELYFATNGQKWTGAAKDLGFGKGTDFCTWNEDKMHRSDFDYQSKMGVLCDPDSSSIISIQLNNSNLSGYLPDSIGDLLQLRVLSLRGNTISGVLPKTLAQLQLSVLFLDNNEFDGAFPPELCPLIDSLRFCRLQSANLNQDGRYNMFNCPVPSCLTSGILFEKCNVVDYNNSSCGEGKCDTSGQCRCYMGWSGKKCDVPYLEIGSLVTLVLILACFFLIAMKKFRVWFKCRNLARLRMNSELITLDEPLLDNSGAELTGSLINDDSQWTCPLCAHVVKWDCESNRFPIDNCPMCGGPGPDVELQHHGSNDDVSSTGLNTGRLQFLRFSRKRNLKKTSPWAPELDRRTGTIKWKRSTTIKNNKKNTTVEVEKMEYQPPKDPSLSQIKPSGESISDHLNSDHLNAISPRLSLSNVSNSTVEEHVQNASLFKVKENADDDTPGESKMVDGAAPDPPTLISNPSLSSKGWVRQLNAKTGEVSLRALGDGNDESKGKKISRKLFKLLQLVSAQPFHTKLQWFRKQVDKLRIPEAKGSIEFQVRRDYLLNDAVDGFGKISLTKDLHKTFRFKFIGEPAVDAGGVAREWFDLVVGLLFNPDFGLFEYTNVSGLSYQINRDSGLMHEEHLNYFFVAGQVIGKAILDSIPIPAHLAPPLFKHILGVPISMGDVCYMDEETYDSLTLLRENPGAEDAMLDFTITRMVFGEPVNIDLKPNGSTIDVTDENKDEYCELVIKCILLEDTSSQLGQLLKGIYAVIPRELLSVFDPTELAMVLAGLPRIDVADWEAHTTYVEPFDKEHEVVRWFWSIVEDLSHEQRARMLQFTTGSSRVPVTGFVALKSHNGKSCCFTIAPLKESESETEGETSETSRSSSTSWILRRPSLASLFSSRSNNSSNSELENANNNSNSVIESEEKDNVNSSSSSQMNPYPVAHTCFNRLDLPVYQTREELETKILEILEMDVTGFSIQ